MACIDGDFREHASAEEMRRYTSDPGIRGSSSPEATGLRLASTSKPRYSTAPVQLPFAPLFIPKPVVSQGALGDAPEEFC